MIGRSGGSFFRDRYEWIAAAVAAAVLAVGVVMFIGSLGGDPEARADETAAQIRRTPPGGEAVEAVDLTDFTRTSKVAKDPTSLTEVTDAQASFLASERRVYCEKCRAAVSSDAGTCPACGAPMKKAEKVVLDGDGDGMPDAWEKKYGLNPADPADAALDKDGDGFTNLEECEAKTDPTDRGDHPDYLDSLTVQLPLKETVLPFHLTGTMKTPGGLKYQFKDPSRAKEYDRGVYSVLAGEEIGPSGFTPEKFETKTAEVTMGGGMKKKVDVSEATVVRKADGKRVTMPIGKKGVPVDVQATLVYVRGTSKTMNVVPGDTIDLNGTKYVVKALKHTEKGAEITFADAKTGKVRIVRAP